MWRPTQRDAGRRIGGRLALRTDTVVSDCRRPSPGNGCARVIRGTGPPNTTRRPHTAGGVRRASQALLLVIEAPTGSR